MIPYLAQINTTPGDFDENCEQIMDSIMEAEKVKADLVVFPELAICGYLVRDLLYLDGFIENNLKYLDLIRNWTVSHVDKDVTIIIGYADRSYKEHGKPFRNMAAVVRNGLIIATYQKQLLPFYDVFDEPRYFESGSELCKFTTSDGEICGITICEDLWNDKGQDDYHYENNPVQRYLDHGVTTIINLSASPWYQGKVQKRIKMAEKVSKSCFLIYVNQIGGQDELVFDGNSMIADGGNVIYMGSGEATECLNGTAPAILGMNKTEELINNLKIGLKDYVHKTGHKEVVINSSGGVDSAAVIALAAEAFGGDNVHCIMMPSKFSSKGSIDDAKKLHAKFGCHEFTVEIDHDPILDTVKRVFDIPENIQSNIYNSVADENIQARMRGMMGAIFFSNAYGVLPLTTGNKTELALGYCTLYGDMSGGFNPIGDLYKDEVYDICRKLGVPREILIKAPSAELAPGQTDEESLLPYQYLNTIVKGFIEEYINTYDKWLRYAHRDGQHFNVKTEDTYDPSRDVSKEDYDKMITRIRINEFKRRQAAPCIKVSKIAFGMGRRMPIVGRF